MIITDGVHLASTESAKELHDFALRIGLKHEWFQSGRRSHYDLTTKRMFYKAVAAGATILPTRQLIVEAWWATKKKSRPVSYKGEMT